MTYLNPMSYNSLLEILTYRVQYQPDKQAYIFLQDGERYLEIFFVRPTDSSATTQEGARAIVTSTFIER